MPQRPCRGTGACGKHCLYFRWQEHTLLGLQVDSVTVERRCVIPLPSHGANIIKISVICVILVSWLLLADAQALADSAPTIEGQSVSQITQHDVTLKAKINPNGLASTYDIILAYRACQGSSTAPKYLAECYLISRIRVAKGEITNNGYFFIVIRLNDLRAHYTYSYTVLAANSAGDAEHAEMFTTHPG